MIKKLLQNGIVRGSLILLVTINIYFALNYFFHFAMARMLPVAEYGILVTLYAILYILGVFTESIQLVVSRYSTKEKDLGKIKNLVKKSIKKSVTFALYLFLIYLIIAIFLSNLLNIEYALLGVTGLMIFTSFMLPIGRGVLQGKKRFKTLGFNMIIESSMKFVFAILLVLAGWLIYGAIIATILGVSISLLASFVSIRGVLSSKEKKASTSGIYGYTTPVFVVILTVILFFSLDVIMARIFFPADVAGYYAIASTLSKIIYFGTLPISKAMFPLATESNEKRGPDNVLLTSSSILSFCIFVSLSVIYLIPGLLIRIFSGRYIPMIEPILIFPAIAISLISFTNLILLYKLSKGAIKNYYILFIFIIIQIILLSYFNDTLMEFSVALVTSAAIFLWGSLFLFNKKPNHESYNTKESK